MKIRLRQRGCGSLRRLDDQREAVHGGILGFLGLFAVDEESPTTALAASTDYFDLVFLSSFMSVLADPETIADGLNPCNYSPCRLRFALYVLAAQDCQG